MKIQEITEKNIKYYQEFVPPELSFLLGIKDYVVLGLLDEKNGWAFPAGISVLSFRVTDAVTMEWLYIAEKYRGHDYSSLFFDTVHDLALANNRTRIIAKLWGRSTVEGSDFLTDLGFVPALSDYTDTVYFLSDLGDIDDLAKEGRQARKVGFELEEVKKNCYIPRIYGTPEPGPLKRAMANALYEAASREKSANASIYLRCAPWEDIAVFKSLFLKKARTITSVCYEAPVDIADYMTDTLEREKQASARFREETDSFPTKFTMIGLEEYLA